MKLRFYAKADLLVMHPESRHMTGQAAQYIGRQFVAAQPAKKATKTAKAVAAKPASYPATKEPFECEADSKVGRRLAKLCRRDGSLWPADKETAAHCGVKFVPAGQRGGAVAAKAKAADLPPPSGANLAPKE